MPLIPVSTYLPPPWLRGRPHLQTIIPSAVRRVRGVAVLRERIDIFDGDFLDLEWSKTPEFSSQLVIVSHGLEGSANRPYMLGMARAFNAVGYDSLCWNMRGCSGEPNRLPRFYHHGATEDLKAVIDHALALNRYTKIVLVGFSLGGNMLLKYLGEQAENVPKSIVKAVSISAPSHLPSSVPLLRNGFFPKYYGNRFKNKLIAKIKAKTHIYGQNEVQNLLKKVRTLDDLTEHFFAQLHGFKNPDEYYNLNSANHFLAAIRVPSLMLNALNDPMLSTECSPHTIAQNSNYVYLETPNEGGHCGFYTAGSGLYWSEARAVEFVSQ